MDTSAHTLLIVDSPATAEVIQKLCPQSVFVIATDGYCWKPRFDAENYQLIAIADPLKASVRREIKHQAQRANHVVVATDSDLSGDFTAWSVARFLSSNRVKRGQIQSLSKRGVISLLSDLNEIETDRLEFRLNNRYLIKSEWYRQKIWPDLHLSGLISIFGSHRYYSHFLDEKNQIFKSSEPIQCSADELNHVSINADKIHFAQHPPLSTFDLLALIVNLDLALTYNDAQQLLHQLFESLLRESGESLISYPITNARGYYTETWEVLESQYQKLGLDRRLKPFFLRDIANPETPNESVHPIDLSVTPDSVRGTFSARVEKVYERIYDQTLKSITISDPLTATYGNALRPDLFFYPTGRVLISYESFSLRPCLTVDDIGREMCRLGIAKPSDIGKNLDEWVDREWIHIDKNVIQPGKTVVEQLQKADSLNKILVNLNRQSELNSLTPETIQAILTSD